LYIDASNMKGLDSWHSFSPLIFPYFLMTGNYSKKYMFIILIFYLSKGKEECSIAPQDRRRAKTC
jgi:hypothetical protein